MSASSDAEQKTRRNGRYLIYVCDRCSEHYPYAGWCECGHRLQATDVVSVKTLISAAEEQNEAVAQRFVEAFLR